MQTNVGDFDRNARLVVGLLALLAGITWLAGALTLDLWLGAVVLLVGVIMTVTGLARTCLIYSLLGMDTLGAGETEEPTTERASR